MIISAVSLNPVTIRFIVRSKLDDEIYNLLDCYLTASFSDILAYFPTRYLSDDIVYHICCRGRSSLQYMINPSISLICRLCEYITNNMRVYYCDKLHTIPIPYDIYEEIFCVVPTPFPIFSQNVYKFCEKHKHYKIKDRIMNNYKLDTLMQNFDNVSRI